MVKNSLYPVKRIAWMLLLCCMNSAAMADNGDLFTKTLDGYTLTFRVCSEVNKTCEAVSVKDLGTKQLHVPETVVRYEDDPNKENVTYEVVFQNMFTALDYNHEEFNYYVVFTVLNDKHRFCEVREVDKKHSYYPYGIQAERTIFNEDTNTTITTSFNIGYSSTTEEGYRFLYEDYDGYCLLKYIPSLASLASIPTSFTPTYYCDGEQKYLSSKEVVMTKTDVNNMTFIFMVSDIEGKKCSLRFYKNSYEGTVSIPSSVVRTVIDLENDVPVETEFTVTGILGGGTHGQYWGALRKAKMETLILPETIDDYKIFSCCETYNINTVINHRPCAPYMNGSVFSSDAEKWVDNDSYNQLYNRSTLYVPFGSYDSYSTTTAWKKFNRIVEGIGENTLQAPTFSLEEGTFYEAKTLTLSNPNSEGDIYYYYISNAHPLLWSEEYYGRIGDVQKYNGEEIPINMTTTVVAIVMKGDQISDAVRKVYTIEDESMAVCGMKINKGNASDVFGDGTVSYDNLKGRVLTLNNATLDANSMKEATALDIWGGDLTLKLIGNNKLTATEYGISLGYDYGKGGEYVGGNTLVISGEGDNASLEIEGAYTGLFSYCSNVVIDNCNVKIRDCNAGIYAKAGGKGDGELTISNATLDIIAGTTACDGIHSLLLEGVSIKEPAGAVFVSSDMGGYIKDDKKGINKGKEDDPVITGNFYVGDVVQSSILIAPSTSSGDAIVTAVGQVQNAPTVPSAFYTLQGVQVEKPMKKGIYLQKGKKYIVR